MPYLLFYFWDSRDIYCKLFDIVPQATEALFLKILYSLSEIHVRKFILTFLRVHCPFTCQFLLACMLSCSVVSNSLRPGDYSPPVFSIYVIFQARILERVAISYPSSYLYILQPNWYTFFQLY